MAKRNGNKLLTGSIIRKLQPPAKGHYIEYDGGPGSVAGFGIRVTAGGHKAFILNYYVRNTGRERRITFASWPTTTATDARAKARKLKREIEDGGDPLADVQAEREAPTVNDLIERFRSEYLPRKRPGTVRDYNSMIDRHIAPA